MIGSYMGIPFIKFSYWLKAATANMVFKLSLYMYVHIYLPLWSPAHQRMQLSSVTMKGWLLRDASTREELIRGRCRPRMWRCCCSSHSSYKSIKRIWWGRGLIVDTLGKLTPAYSAGPPTVRGMWVCPARWVSAFLTAAGPPTVRGTFYCPWAVGGHQAAESSYWYVKINSSVCDMLINNPPTAQGE